MSFMFDTNYFIRIFRDAHFYQPLTNWLKQWMEPKQFFIAKVYYRQNMPDNLMDCYILEVAKLFEKWRLVDNANICFNKKGITYDIIDDYGNIKSETFQFFPFNKRVFLYLMYGMKIADGIVFDEDASLVNKIKESIYYADSSMRNTFNCIIMHDNLYDCYSLDLQYRPTIHNNGRINKTNIKKSITEADIINSITQLIEKKIVTACVHWFAIYVVLSTHAEYSKIKTDFEKEMKLLGSDKLKYPCIYEKWRHGPVNNNLPIKLEEWKEYEHNASKAEKKQIMIAKHLMHLLGI